MRWQRQTLTNVDENALPGLAKVSPLVRSVTTPEFSGLVFHEILARSALNRVPGESTRLPYAWTINPYRGCSHACVYCFARNTHTYLDLDAGKDFDTQVVVKTNVVEVLRSELKRKAPQIDQVMLGTNTDPYQRAEGKYRLMPGIITALADAGVPFSILTKGTLLRRDLDLLVAASQRVEVSLAMSIAVFDDRLQQSIEPGTPSTKARLATVSAVRDAGLACSVFMMPVLPMLTDNRDLLDRSLTHIREAGASSVMYAPLHLRSGVKPWFMSWLGREYPDLVAHYRTLYPGRSATATKEYRHWLASQVRPLIRRHGLDRASPRAAAQVASEQIAADQGATLSPQPTLF